MKIICVGMNYAEHCKELNGSAAKPESPVIFMKPDSALLKGGKPFFIPDFAERFEYEAELVVRINKLGKTVIVVTHDEELLRRYRKRTIRIRAGEIISDGIGWDGYENGGLL